jgi:hypothetical protein
LRHVVIDVSTSYETTLNSACAFKFISTVHRTYFAIKLTTLLMF